MSRLESNYQIPVPDSGDNPSVVFGKSFENTLAFAGEASAVPFDLKSHYPPKPPKQSNEQWQRDWRITGLYLGTDRTLKEIGEVHALSSERVRQIIRRNLEQLRETSDEDIKRRYPIESLKFGKPFTIESLKRISLGKGGKSVEVQTLMHQGKSVNEIKAELKLTGAQLTDVRIILRGWDENLPYEKEANSPEYRQNLERLKSDRLSFEEAQKILDKVTSRVYKTHVGGDKALFFPIRKLAQETGLFVSSLETASLVKILKEERIAIGMMDSPTRKQRVRRYHFIAISDKERAKQVLLSHPELAPFRVNPVRVLGKDSEDIPTCGRLKNSGLYLRVGAFFKEIGYPSSYATFRRNLPEIIDVNCPVSFFVYRSRNLGSKSSVQYYYETGKKEELKAYLLERTSELKKRSSKS